MKGFSLPVPSGDGFGDLSRGSLDCGRIGDDGFQHQLARTVERFADLVAKPDSAPVQRVEGAEQIDGGVGIADFPQRGRRADHGRGRDGGNRSGLARNGDRARAAAASAPAPC